MMELTLLLEETPESYVRSKCKQNTNKQTKVRMVPGTQQAMGGKVELLLGTGNGAGQTPTHHCDCRELSRPHGFCKGDQICFCGLHSMGWNQCPVFHSYH